MDYYDQISKGYSELHGHEQECKARIIASKLKLKKNQRLLDVGCGNGSYLKLFRCKAFGVDPSKELIKQYHGKHKLMIGLAENLPFKDKYFDAVISITSAHNFRSPEQGIKEMRRVSKDKLVFSLLKRSKKLGVIEKLLYDFFMIEQVIEQEQDIIFFCRKKR